MKINQYGQVTVSQEEALTALYSNKLNNLNGIRLDNVAAIKKYNQSIECNADVLEFISELDVSSVSLIEFDQNNQACWYMSKTYENFDIINWIYDRCSTDQQRNRVSKELELFVHYNMYDLLIYLKYLVDLMQANKVLWGVGRGSSISSYCLFLIGIHKIDSLKYNLDIHEFLPSFKKDTL